MNFSDKHLLRQLTLVLLVKIIILLALWGAFIRERAPVVDDRGVAAQLLAPAVSTP